METKANLSFNTRAFVQVMIPVLWLLGCLFRALGYLSGKQGGCLCFSHCFVRNRRYALFPGGTIMDKLTEASIGYRKITMNNNIATMESITHKRSAFSLTDKTKEWIVFGICLLCLALFASAAYQKLADHETFYKGLSKVSLIGGAAIYIAWLVPIAESLICLLLLIPRTQKVGLYSFSGLMTVFTGYILSMLLWTEKLPCHCNLIIEKLSWAEHLWFNAGFIALAVFALWLGKAKELIKK